MSMPPSKAKATTDPSKQSSLESLRTQWTTLYHIHLPNLARLKDPSQPNWPVTLDHCFARIILDDTIGKSAGSNGEAVQWDKVLKKPALRNMSQQQLRAAIDLGERIARGEENLEVLDRRSLKVRGKDGKYGRKRKREEANEDEGGEAEERKEREDTQAKKSKKRKKDEKQQSTLSFSSSNTERQQDQLPSPITTDTDDTAPTDPRSSLEKDLNTTSHLPASHLLTTLKRIQTYPSLTPFRKRLYTSLLSVPPGSYTTYAALATYLNSVPRAVGNGMRNNPFAPDVPCHRVLASDGTIGGFGGDWGRDGKNAGKKVELLSGEGVRFDSTGRVKGGVWRAFWDLEKFEREYGKLH